MRYGWRQLLAIFLLVPTFVLAGTDPLVQNRAREQALLLQAKDPVTWRIVPGGASGTLSYNAALGSFSFSAQRLSRQTEYLLVRYADAPPHGQILARGRTDHVGSLSLKGTWQDWTRKFWLVPGSDVVVETGGGDQPQRGRLIAWHPERYLFEDKILGISCACD